MSDTQTTPTLLPYLNGSSPGLSLELDLSNAAPLAVADHCGPYTAIRRGRIVMDGCLDIADMVVLAQVDEYAPVSSELAPVTNLDIETSWQAAWRAIQGAPRGPGAQSTAMVLPTQVDGQGALVALRPLFFCRHQKRYGHALCPFCGGALTLCRDDAALQRSGLQPYGAGLDRYLYCPACHEKEEPAPFYRHALPAGPPSGVLGCEQLIEDFSRLLARDDLAGELPCIGCSQALDCFGAETLALKRMAAVHFYPFHMLMQRAPSLNAVDFIALLSGAGRQEIESELRRTQKSGRLALLENSGAVQDGEPGFLFADDSRFFLEVLYLKLSFLHALWPLAMAGGAGPVNRMSLEGVGVKVGSCGSRLPYLWNFSLQLIDPVGRPLQKTMVPTVARTLAVEFFTRAWFYVLLVNPRQSMEQVIAAVAALSPLAPSESENPGAGFSGAVFAPGNIFWTGSAAAADGPADALWWEALDLGTRLTALDTVKAGGASPLAFEQELTALKARVRKALFQADAQVAPAVSKTVEENPDHRIADILETLLEKWTPPIALPDEARPIAAADPAMKPNEDGDYEETVILSALEAAQAPQAEGFSASMTEKTVVLAPSETGANGPDRKKTPAGDLPRSPSLLRELEKTVAKSSGGNIAPVENDLEKTVVMPQGGPADIDLEETVAMSPHAGAPRMDDPEKTVILSAPSKAPASDDLDKTVVMGSVPASADELDETIIQSSAGEAAARRAAKRLVNDRAKADSPPDQEDLQATVVLQPKSGKDRKPTP